MSKVLQLLNRPVWSKRTSQILFAVLAVGCLLVWLWSDWVTPRERRLIQEAINKTDEFKDSKSLSASDFEKRNSVLLQLVDKAAQSQITERDKVAVLLLRGYVVDLSYHRIIWNMPEGKLEGLRIKGIFADGNGQQKKLDWLALEEKQHNQNRAILEQMIGN
jgi:hypothetical protein